MKTAARRHRAAYVHPVGHEVGWPPAGPNRRQPLLDYKVPNPFWRADRAAHASETTRASACPCAIARQGALDVVGSAHLHRVQFHPQFPGGALQRFEPSLARLPSAGKQPPG